MFNIKLLLQAKSIRGSFHSNSTYLLSDDRAKFDEVALNNAWGLKNLFKKTLPVFV